MSWNSKTRERVLQRTSLINCQVTRSQSLSLFNLSLLTVVHSSLTEERVVEAPKRMWHWKTTIRLLKQLMKTCIQDSQPRKFLSWNLTQMQVTPMQINMRFKRVNQMLGEKLTNQVKTLMIPHVQNFNFLPYPTFYLAEMMSVQRSLITLRMVWRIKVQVLLFTSLECLEQARLPRRWRL